MDTGPVLGFLHRAADHHVGRAGVGALGQVGAGQLISQEEVELFLPSPGEDSEAALLFPLQVGRAFEASGHVQVGDAGGAADGVRPALGVGQQVGVERVH